MVTTDGDSIKEVKIRITKARQAFAALNNLWKSSKINLKIKCRISKRHVLRILLYGSEFWKMTQTMAKLLDTFRPNASERSKGYFGPTQLKTMIY
jgi:hypothetical protein